MFGPALSSINSVIISARTVHRVLVLHRVLQVVAQRGAQFHFMFAVLRALFSCSKMRGKLFDSQLGEAFLLTVGGSFFTHSWISFAYS